MGAGSTPAGWYPDVERPGGERYWDGSLWTGQRRNAGDTTSAFPSAPTSFEPPGYGQPIPQPTYGSPAGSTPYGSPETAHPKSSAPSWALGLSISGLVLSICCIGFVLSIPGTVMGWTSMKAIDRGEKDPSQRGVAKAAFIVGVIGLVIAACWIMVVVIGGTFSIG